MLKSKVIILVQYSKGVANLILIGKENGDIFLCVDFRSLHKASVNDNFQFPSMDLVLQQVNSKMIYMFDIFLGYNQ